MEQEKSTSVESAQESSASKENLQDHSPVEDYKRDMFKYKERAKSYEAKLSEYESKLKNYEMEEQKKNGNYSQVIDELKEKARTLESDLKRKDYLYAKSNIEAAISNEAVKRGCKNTDVFLRLIEPSSFDLVSLNEKFVPDSRDVQTIVEDHMKKYGDIGLFKASVNIVDKSPNNSPTSSRKPKSLSELTDAELREMTFKLDGVKRLENL